MFLLYRLTSSAFTIDSTTPTVRRNLNEHSLENIERRMEKLERWFQIIEATPLFSLNNKGFFSKLKEHQLRVQR
jgi:hypothetical protein